MSFPVYDIFSRQAKADPTELTQEQKKKLIDNIKLLDKDGLDNLYMIIRHSAHLENDEKVYNSKYNSRTVICNLENMPNHLQKLIYFFVNKHISELQKEAPVIDIVFDE